MALNISIETAGVLCRPGFSGQQQAWVMASRQA